MKIYIVFRAYYLSQFEVYKVFLNENKANKCRDELLNIPNVRSYIVTTNIDDSN